MHQGGYVVLTYVSKMVIIGILGSCFRQLHDQDIDKESHSVTKGIFHIRRSVD